MNAWRDLPRNRLLADISLWSADLANLASEIRRVDVFADSYHLDASDAHFAPGLLFFPDLVRAMRPLTVRPFHVHLMSDRPAALIAEFAAAGANAITVHVELGERETTEAIEAIRRSGCSPGLALRLETPVSAARPHLDRIDSLLLLGTEMGVKGRDLAPQACSRFTDAASLLGHRRADVRLIADGGIRRETVPLLRRAGADVIVPGSLVFQSQDLVERFDWLHSL